MAPKDQDAIHEKVESFTDTNMTGWIVMWNTLVNPLELLVRGSKNISGHPPSFMTTKCHHRKLWHCREGRPEPLQMDQRSIIHKGK